MNVQVHNIHPQFGNSILQRIREKITSYPELNVLKEMIYSGWPSTIQQVPVPLIPYTAHQGTVENLRARTSKYWRWLFY